MIKISTFGTASGINDGKKVSLYQLVSDNGKLSVTLTDFGARIVDISVKVGDEIRRVVRGFDDLASYEGTDGYIGAVVGRYGNRVGKGKFTIDGTEYELFLNDNGKNSLHGGMYGFDRKIWDAETSEDGSPSVTFSAFSPDGEEGYPGNLGFSVRYELTAENGLHITYMAVSDKKTVINLTNHAYFNLSGEGYVGDHSIFVDADRFIPTDSDLVPTGKIASLDGHVLDFRKEKKMSEAIESDNEDITLGGGIDHCLVFTDRGEGFKERIKVTSPDGKLTMKVLTDRPCVQFYSGNFLGNPDYPFRNNVPQMRRHAFCLETEYMPDAMNHPGFTDPVILPDEEWETRTEYRFCVSE